MDGRGRFLDNIFIERLWRSLKYPCTSMNSGTTRTDHRLVVQLLPRCDPIALGGRTPGEAYRNGKGTA